MSTSATLIALRLKRFNCRTTVKILIHIKYIKNANHLGIVENSDENIFMKIWSTADLKHNFIVY